MSVDNKKYKIALPDGRTTVWTQEQFDKQGEALLSKYPDANIVTSEDYDPSASYEAGVAYGIQTPDGRSTYWDADQFGKQGEALMSKYPDAKITVYNDASKSYWRQKAEEQKESMTRFDQDNHDFMFKHEMDKILYDSGEGNITEDAYLADDAKYNELATLKKKLQADYSNNPYVQAIYKTEAQYSDGKAAEYDSIRKSMRGDNPFLGASRQMQSGTEAENDEYMLYGQAKDLARNTAKTFAVETVKAPGENGFVDYLRNYGKAYADVFSDPDFWSRGITEISRNLNLRDIMQKLESKGINLNEVTEKQLDENLTGAEKALLSEFVRNVYAKATRAADMAPGYTAGQVSAESIGFMAEFLATGAIGRALGAGVGAAEEASSAGLRSWIARELRKGSADAIESSVKRNLVNSLTKGGKVALTQGMKNVVSGASRAASGAYSGIVRPVEQAIWHTALQPSTYRQISENLTQIDNNGELISAGNAIWGGVLDQMVENWSETMGGAVETVLGMPFKAAGWAGEKVLGRTTLGQWGKWLADSQAARVLHDAGFNGLIGEMGEEWLGNAARVGLGIMDKDEFKNFASWNEQLEMAASFAPMSLFGLGSSTYAAARQAKEYKQAAEAMRGVLNRAGMTEDEISDIMDTKHTKKEIADALTPVIQRIVHGRQDNTTATEDYITTLKFAQASAMNEVVATAQSIEKEKEREMVRRGIGEELGATSEGDERGRFTHIMKTDRLDADGNPFELEAVTTVKDADGAEWFYMGDNGSQVVLKKRGENGGKPMFLSQEQYAQRVESGEYTETTQLATQFLDEEAEKIRTAEEQARTSREVQDRYAALLNVFSQNPDINLGTEDAPMNGRVTEIGRDGIIVDFGQPVLLNGVTRQIHKISLEQAGNAVGIDTAMRGDEQRERDSIDQEYLNRQKVSAYNKTYAGKEFTLDGEPYRFVRMFEAPYLDESGTEQVKVTATDARGEDVEVVLPLEELQSQALTPQEQTRSDADQDEAGARVITETTGSLKDFRGNDIPMRINEKTGEEEVDKREFKKRDPEAYYRWNDSRRGGNTSDSMEAIQADITAKTAEKDTLAAQRQGETDPDMRDELEGQINRLNNEINLLAGIYHKYDAAGNFQNAQRQYAEKFADIERRMLNAKTQDQYDELVTIQRELAKDYFTEMQDAAYTMTLNQRTVELQSALNEIADVPVQVVTMAQIEEVMRSDNASEDAIAKVLDKIADIQRRNMVEGKSYALDGLHYNGKVYIFAEGNRNIDDARVTYYHERQHDINKRNPAAVDAVLVLADNNHDALFQTLTAIIGDAGTYRKSDERTLADEIVAFTMEKAWTNPEYVDELRALGLSDELINIISSEYGRQQGTSEDLDSGSGDRTARNSDSGQADYRIDEQAQRGESGDEQLGSAQPGVEAEEPIGSITPETAAELADKSLVMDGGVVMSADLSALKQAVGYLTPNEKSPEQEIVEYSVRTRKAWADNYRKYPDSEERVIRALENLAERMAADELVSGVISQGNYKYGKKDKGSFAGPLRTNIEYIVTFDMDTTCPRTFQYLNYVKQIENRIGRPLTQTECIQLTEMMRMYGQQIPCVYCYSENKRQALKQYYTDFMTARHAVLNAATDEEALEHMYGHGTSKAARESNDPAVALNEAAYKVFLQWRSERKTAYNPSLKMLWFQYSNDRNVVLNVLDQLYADGRIMTDLNDDVIAAVVDTELRINDPAAVKVVEDIVSEWKWDAIEGREHSDFTPVEEDDLVVDPRTLSLWREMTSYAKSASQAKSVLRYIPYTDELKKLSQEQKDYINGMGGVRMHSSNDFRIDYVFDYFQFMADMAANKMFGHTYTKSPEFVRIFGNSGYKINMSIAAYEDEKGNIRMNEDEGFNWDVAKELRDAFPNAGVMLMATSDNQIQMALDSDWIDMFIPFHASSLPKSVWYNMRAWKDYTTVQNEAFLNGDEMRAALISDGVELPKNIKAADVERMYLEHFNIKTIIGTAGKQKGKRLRPHFLPGPTVVDGQYVPGHDNDTERYLQLCREYGVHPRFYGIKVKNAEGKTIDITEHPNYIKCIKETARTDSPQTAVRFNFDQPSEALGGKTPIEYAFDELQARAAAEMQAAGSPVRDIYKSLEKDAFGIVPQFIDTIIKHKEKTGKDYPIDYITPDSRKWFLTERKALEEAYKDIETIPYHRNEYDIEGKPVKTRVAEKSNDAQKIEQQKALDFINGTRSFAEEGGDIRYSIRTKPAPKSTGIGYKVFYLKDGKLYPPMVANPGGADTPVGVWLDADAAPQAAASKTGRKKVKAGGKGTQGGSGTLAYRPGWHLGEIPYALQFNRGPKVDNPLGITGKNGKAIKVGKYFPANFVWAEVEYAKDVDYQDEAMSYGYNGAGNFQHSLAGLPKIPVDGSYTYRTNANPATDPWIITGAMKVNRILTDSEVDELVRQAGREPQLREGKTEEPRDVRENNEPNFRVVNDNQQVFVSNALASLDKIPMKSGNAQAWINKIQQAGGLKKEEDKWMGLTDWLKEQKGNISKEDVAGFIREHQVQIEEVKYGTTPINTDYSGAIAGEKGVEFRDRFLDAFNVYLEEGDEDMGIPDRFRSELVNDEEAMDLYNENHEDKVSLDEEGYLDNVAQDKVMTWGDEILDAVTGTGEKPVNSTRMSYTTDGLDNNREIALVVPTIEPYKESDDVHFGDAGEGRAVAWSRFGDAVDKDGNKVLVIDEIQSKRHQDAKENGYSEKDIPSKMDAYLAKEKAFEDYDRVFAELSGKYSEEDVREMLMSDEDNASYKDVLEKRKEANHIYNLAISRVPDAPFHDSWDALAMKRMLRFAAEEGYDKIAWTSGQMQSDRYDLTKVLDDFYYKPNGDGTYKVSAALNQRRTGYTEYSDLNYDSLTVDRIGEIFGKEIAAKVSEGKGRKGYSHNDERDWITFSGRDLKMANEGMRYFYDQKLVNWMNKYGKKWGVQVADLTLPGLENEDGWHSVDVTAEMKKSVMEGQPLFRATEVAGNPSLIAVHNLTENDLLDAFDLGGFPMPSIAITKADIGHTDFGDISLVFGKETINPKNRKNKVYSGDAWTPTFPTINYKLNEDKASDIATRARKVGDLPLFNPSHFNSVNYEGRIEDFGARSLIEEFKNDYNAKQFYLAEQGNPVREYEMHEVEKYTEENVRRIKELLDKIGLENLKGVDRNLTPEILQVVKGFLDAVGDIDDSRIKRIARNYVVHAIDYATNGNRTAEIDYDATHRKIDERIDQSAFEKWLEDLFSGIVEKRGIRNEVDMFTPIGNRRAWEKLYDEVTLDNVVKAMSKKPERGGSGFFGGNIFGASFKTYNSIADIREDAARRMAVVDSEELQKQKDDILNRLSNVKVTEKELGVGEMFDLTTNIKDAVAKSHTAEGIHRYLKDYYPDITMDAAQEIADIVKDIQSISTKYFEAKPYRAVGFDEVKLAVVPEDASQAIVDGLQERGVPVRTYEKDNQQERMDIISNATEEMGLRFRTVEITPETRDEMEQIKALARLNGTYLKAPNGADTKLTPEQWAMVRTKAFKAWFGDWENDPASASKVVDENGEPMVMYHGTGREFYTFGNTDSANELGAGFYFTDNRRLAEAYTNPRLSDNESKIEARAMEIFIDDMGHSEEDSYDNEFVHDYNEAYDMAETELFGKPRVMSVFLNVRNPRMVVDNSNLEEEQGEHDGVIDNTFGKRHGGLMIQSRAGESAMQVMVYNPNQIKSATDNNGSFDPTDPDIRYRAIPGGASMAERTYRESGAFSFTGSERINSIDDVAFIFRELENYATENSFIVFVKDGMPTILHTGIGDMRSTFIDTAAAVAGYNDFAPDTVYLVHNHPSGNLVASGADMNALAKLKDVFSGVPVGGIILDAVSGNYGYFDEEINIEKAMPEEGDEFPVKVLSFDKVVFDKEFKSQLNERKVAGPHDIAAFLSAHRLGKGKKLGVLLLNNAQYIVANYVTNDNSLTTRNADRIARQVANIAVHSNANRAIMFGNFNFDDKSLRSFSSSFKKASGETMSLLDVVQMNHDGGYVSVNDDTLHGRNDATMYRITPAQDAEYMSAVEAGDMEEAERMVRDAAKAAGYNLEAYHGTDVDFNEFKRVHHANGNIWGSGFYFADSEDAAAGWGERASIVNFNDDYKVLHTYLSVHNPFELYNDRLELGLGEYAEDVISKLDPEYDADIIEAIRTGTRIEDFRGWANDRIAEAIQELGFDAIQGYYYDEYHTMVFSPNQIKSADPVTYDDEGNIIPLSRRFNPESSDIRFRTLDKTEVFKKIRNSKEAIISGDEIEFTPGDDKGNKKKALDYGKRLQGTYINADTGLSIQLQRGRHNGGLNEVLKHDYKNEEHIKSIAAIPQLIENGILIAEVPNEDKPKNPTVSYYQHYVCGLKIGDSEYTVHALIAVDAKGDRYYDHNLISIEKENLLNLLSQAENNNGFGTTPDTKSTTITGHKFNKLISILQSLTDVKARITPAQDAEYRKAYESGDTEKAMQMVKDAFNAAYPNNKIVDENGEPMVVYRGQNWDKQDGKMTSGLFVSLDEDFAEGYGDVKPLFVRSVNPFNGEKDAESLRQFVEENFDELQAEYEAFFDEEEGYEDVDSLMDALNENWWIAYEYSDILRNEIIRRGYDSIFIREDADNIWLTSPDQIKSAEPFTFDDNGNLIPLSERFNNESDDIRFRISPEQDQEFRKAYEAGDVAKAIEMLDAAAIAAGYDTKAFHGTEKGFNVFQADYRTGGNFFTPQEDAAKAYADAQSSGNGGVVIPVYLNLGKTFEIDAKESQWDEVPVEWEVDSREDDYDEFFDSYGDAEREALKHPDAVISSSGISDTNDIAKRAKNDGYDSVIIRNVYDPGDSSYDSMQDDIVIFTPSRIKSAEPFTFDDDGDLIPLSQRFNPESDDIRFRVTSRQDDGYRRPDGLSDAEMADRKRNAMSGLQDFDREAVADMLMKIFEEVPEEIRAVITDNAASTGYNFGKAAVNYFAALAERDELNDGERNAIAIMRDNLKEMLGIDNLSLDDALWSLYRTSTAGERDLLAAARKAIVADRLGHSPADEASRREIDDELRFSIRRNMESMSAADMYNKATSYYMNRLKESFVDMNESVNDLVTAIEKATGMKAEAFEDIRLALNQQSSKGLAAMSKYTSDYLEPLWAQIDTVMKATGMSYDDVVRYVMLKHAVERNDVFAKRDAKSFYRAEFDKVVDPLLADRKKLEKDRKKALADGDITTADECDGKIQAIDVQVAAEQKKLDRHNVMVDNGTAAKYKEFREQDYGGLTSMYSEYPGLLPRDRYKTDEEYNQAARKVRKPIYQTVAEMEVAALGEVDAFERRASGDEFDKLWEKINAATKATLESQYKSNVISKDQYMAVRDEFKYYVPLRGFKDTTAEDIWSYYNTSHSGDFSPAILGAKGRRTEAENPFNWIGTMASSAIAQNMKNESKLALYYFIANRPDQDLMSIKDVWYQFDPTATAEYQQKNPGSRKRVFREVHPPFNESLNADSAKNAYDLWEENMRQQAKNGLAFRGSNSLKVGDDVVFIGAGEAAQHIINLKLRGKEVSLILNANPRAAQAINGLLNIETEGGYQKIFGPVLRWMSAVNTSYNPEFWISNMQRDILFALMGTSIKGRSTSKFLGNLVNPKKIMRMMKAYEEGTLGNSEVENYYREFAESGAITGFTVVSGNEVWEKKIAEFLDPSIWDKIQNSGFMMFWQNLGEAVEQMTRFSAYMSARKSGKDIVEATNAAKEISVNFNRKGSGKHISVEELDKLTRKDGSRLNKTQKAGVYLMSLIPAYGRRAVMFFNAAIQGLNAMYKLWKKNPKRFVGWMTGYFALGVIQAVLHALFDDDDDYLDMPDYTRRNNLLIGYDGIYLKWAMPQEARAFYAFGDMAVNHIMGREPNKNLALEMGNAIADMLPLSATDGVTGLLPSAAQPLVELYTNKDFTGARIYNDMRYLSEDERSKTPKYANALPQTGKIFVNVTEFLNYITGGSEWDAGYINVHPEAIQHVVEGAGGGLLTTINKAWETVGGAIDAAAGLDVTGEKLSVRRFPFLNRLLEVNDERSRNSHVSELFYYYKSEAEHTRTKMSKMKKAGDSDGLSELVESREYEIYTIYKSYEKLMKRYDEQIKIEEDRDEKKALMREQDEYRKEMIYEISRLE